MDEIKRLLGGNLRQYGLLTALLAIVMFFNISTNGIILTPLNITNILLQNSYVIILSVGMLFVIVSGDFDLSVGSAVGLIGAIAGVLCVQMSFNPLLTILICLFTGCILGAWQGFFIAYMKIPAFVVTLGNMLLFRGLMLLTLKSQTIGPFPAFFSGISLKFIPDPISGESSLKWLTIIIGVVAAAVYVFVSIRKRQNERKYGIEIGNVMLFTAKKLFIILTICIFAYTLAKHEGIPNVLVLIAILVGIYSFIANKTTVGRRIYATGGNEKATRLSGINTKKLRFMVFVNMGLMAAVAGIVYAARLNYATPTAGSGFELDAIAACFIGGASARGGTGTLQGTIIGALIMGILNNGMSLMGLGVDIQQSVKGLVLILAVLFDVINKAKVR